MAGDQGARRVEMLGHYEKTGPAAQCAATHFLVNSWSSANPIAHMYLAAATLIVLELTVAFAVC
jgi:hypothetical protein